MFTLAIGTKLKIVLWINDVKADIAPESQESLKNFLKAEAASKESQGDAAEDPKA